MEEDEILKYSMQIAMLKQLLRKELIKKIKSIPKSCIIGLPLALARILIQIINH